MLDIVLSLLGSCIPAVPPGSLYDLTFREMSALCLVVDSVVLTVNPSASHGQGFPVSVFTLERDAATWKVVPIPPSLGLTTEAIETFISWLITRRKRRLLARALQLAQVMKAMDALMLPRDAIDETKIGIVEFPEEDESVGEILAVLFGPDCIDRIESSALNMLLTYLCGSSVSVLENVMVEKEELASSVSYRTDPRPKMVIWLQATGVATEKLEFVEKRLFELLKEVASKPIDMDYMRECIRREKRQVKYLAETDEDFYAMNIINDYVFGKRDGSTLKHLEDLEQYDELEKWTDQQWRDFLSKWMVDAPHISILGKPSKALAAKMKKNEEDRLAKRKEDLGAERLEEFAKRLEAAKKKNDEPIPTSVIDRWSVPGPQSIHFIESDTARSGHACAVGQSSGPAQNLIDSKTRGELPLFLQFENVPTDFVHIIIHIGTPQVPKELKPLMPIFMDNFFNTHIMRDGKQVDFEQVVMELKRDTIAYSLQSSRRMGDPDGIMIMFLVESKKYATAVEWIRTMMFDSIFDPQRLKTSVIKALAAIPKSKRDGNAMANEVNAAIHMKKSSLAVAELVLPRVVYLKKLQKLLESNPETVVDWFNTVQNSLFTLQNLRLLVTANLEILQDPLTTWDTLSKSLAVAKKMIEISKPVDLLKDEGRKPGSVGAIIVPMATLENSYSISTAQGLTSFGDPRLASIMVAIAYLEVTEGPLWKAVRGAGCAYGSGFSPDITSGVISYHVYRSSDVSKTIKASKDAISKIANGEVKFDRSLLKGAISQIILELAQKQSTMPRAAQQKFVQGVVRGLSKDWDTEILRRVRAVTEDEIKTALRETILPCFEPGKSNVVVTSAKAMQEGMETAFKCMGYKVQTYELSYFHDEHSLDPEGGEETEFLEEDQELDRLGILET
ncbi:Metalloenzyme, LuxS/M16 peptidase-like protein [Fusarium oxysporum f. sp. albedinis]|nr:Metalloenzyme, LuxS/M16 peptidase-like protein [Fusarium oxysporum f. sp. albedinis]